MDWLRKSGLLCLIMLLVSLGVVYAQDGDKLAFGDNDTLEEIRFKIDYNGYDFKVDNNWVYDMTPEEKKIFFSRKARSMPEHINEDMGPLANELGRDLPSSFDWRNYNGHSYIGAVRNQGSCGSCYAFGASACAEGSYNLATGNYDGNCVDFSESFIIWCLATLPAYSSHFSGCDGADYSYSELEALVQDGTLLESSFPYQTSNPGSCTHWGDTPRVTFDGWYRVPCNDIDAIKTAIMTYGVVDAAVYADSAWSSYSGGIYENTNTSCTGSPCSYTTSNHAISLVGWDDNGGDGYWILRNSYGTTWGESGYMRTKYTSAAVGCAVCYLVYDSSAPTPTPAPPTYTPVPGYCTASGTTCDEYIARVQTGTIDNSSTCGNYVDYTGISTLMNIGTGYSFTITNGNTSYSTDQCGIWVDWNQDLDFSDANETITVTNSPSAGPYTGTITPPVGATLGATRMRIRIMYTGTVSACGTSDYGEVEDYTINVQNGSGPTNTPVPSTNTPTNTPVGPTNTPTNTPSGSSVIYVETFETVEAYVCTGPLGDAGCTQTWHRIDPQTQLSTPLPACDGTYIAWQGYEACNSPNGPDHLLIMDGNSNPNHNMTGYCDLSVCLDWFLNTNVWHETMEIYVACADYGTLDCTNLGSPWEQIYSEMDVLNYASGTCANACYPLSASYDGCSSLVVAVRYLGYDGNSVAIDNLSIIGTACSGPTNTPVPATNTPTNTPVQATNTPTNTSVPATNTPTNTPVPATNTPTNTPVASAGDTCGNPIVISSLPYQDIDNTSGYTHDYDEVCTYSGSTSPDVVYRYYSPVTQTVDLTLCQAVSDYDTKLYVYEGTCPDTGSPYACNDDSCQSPAYGNNYQSQLLDLTFTGGNTYYIVVDGYGGESGNYQLNVTADSAPTNTPVPPTNTPTNTPVPSTNTPTNTPVPSTNTPVPSNDLIWVADAFGCNGYSVFVDIMIDNQDTIVDAFTFHLGYDTSMLSYVSCTEGDLNPGWSMFSCNEATSGDITISGFTGSTGIVSGSYGSFVRLTFDVACSGCINGDNSDLIISEMMDDLVGFAAGDGQFTYDCSMTPTPTPQSTPNCIHDGDVTMDGNISAGDAQLAFNIALATYSPTFEEECAADCNNDGSVSAGDAQAIFNAALGTGSCADPISKTARRAGLLTNEGRLHPDAVTVTWLEVIQTGSLVTVDVNVSNPRLDIDAFTVEIGFDVERMGFMDCVQGDLDPGWLMFDCNLVNSDRCKIAAFTVDSAIESDSFGTIAQLQFQYLGDGVDIGEDIVTLISLDDDLEGSIR